MKNVLVTGAGTLLGRRLLHHLGGHEGVERLFGIEPEASSDWVDGAELVPFPEDHRGLVALLTEYSIDTVIHCDLAPDRSGSQIRPSEARVIETMRLGAGVADPDAPVRAWVIASSSSIYPVSTHAPFLHRESSEVETAEGSPAASIHEAEDYARDVAARHPHLDVAILRLQHLVGEGVQGPLSALLTQPILPKVVGYDPPIQMLAIRDALRAITFAAHYELAGIYNVASAGTIRPSQIARRLDKLSVPVLPLQPSALVGALARRFGVPHVPDGLLDILCFGHALEIGKLAAAGFQPEYDQERCLAILRDSISGDRSGG